MIRSMASKYPHGSRLGTGARARLVLMLIWVFAFRGVWAVGTPVVGVLYPQVRPPYDRIFAEINSGIDRGVHSKGGEVRTYILLPDVDQQEIARRLDRDGVQTLIVLGNRGLNLARALPGRRTIIIGAVNATPDTNGKISGGISLAPDPEVMFRRLQDIDPKVKRVHVVYNPEKNAWLIDLARRAAQRHALSLEDVPASSLQEAAKEYRTIIDRAGHSDAIWLIPDRTVFDSRAILPLLLEEAWDRRFAVFSANPSQVSKGALFALYPNNEGMGRRLAKMALQPRNNGRKAGVALLEDVMIAVNTRTARRLGLRFSGTDRRQFDLVFPTN